MEALREATGEAVRVGDKRESARWVATLENTGLEHCFGDGEHNDRSV